MISSKVSPSRYETFVSNPKILELYRLTVFVSVTKILVYYIVLVIYSLWANAKGLWRFVPRDFIRGNIQK